MKSIKIIAIMVIALLTAGKINAAEVIGTATYNNSTYNLIYEEDSIEGGLVWMDHLKDTPVPYDELMTWASNIGGDLTVSLNPGYSTDIDWSTGWRLPLCQDQVYGSDALGSEPGHLYYVTGMGLFSNLSGTITSGTLHSASSAHALNFNFDTGFQANGRAIDRGTSLVVHAGAVQYEEPVVLSIEIEKAGYYDLTIEEATEHGDIITFLNGEELASTLAYSPTSEGVVQPVGILEIGEVITIAALPIGGELVYPTSIDRIDQETFILSYGDDTFLELLFKDPPMPFTQEDIDNAYQAGLDACEPETIEVEVEVPGPTVYVDVPGETVYVDVPGETVYVDVPGETVYVDVPGETVYVDVPGADVPGPTVYVDVPGADVPGPTVYVDVPGPTVYVDVPGADVPGPTVYVDVPVDMTQEDMVEGLLLMGDCDEYKRLRKLFAAAYSDCKSSKPVKVDKPKWKKDRCGGKDKKSKGKQHRNRNGKGHSKHGCNK